jgi:hypothetical protein
MSDWRRWIGLPHEFGADPEDGKACDCLVMVWRILDNAGIPHPSMDPRWLQLAGQKRWAELEALWRDGTVELAQPEEHAVTLIRNGPAGLGVSIVVDDGLLLVHHKRGVRWVPLSYMPNLRFYKFR